MFWTHVNTFDNENQISDLDNWSKGPTSYTNNGIKQYYNCNINSKCKSRMCFHYLPFNSKVVMLDLH